MANADRSLVTKAVSQAERAGLASSIWSAITSRTIAGILGLASNWSVCWAAEPPIPAEPPPGLNVVQFYNQSDETILLGAFGPTPVKPVERGGSWVLEPQQWLTLDIPASWEYTILAGNKGVRFWARTGCRFDAAKDIAQCETGDCGGKVNCSAALLAGVAPATLAEFCFNCGPLADPPAKQPPSPPLPLRYWDVSVVDGANLSVDITPLGSHSTGNPYSPGDIFWCKSPNVVAGADLRGNCPVNFQLKRSDLAFFIQGSTDSVVACFSNCGRYEYPTAPSAACTNSTDARCGAWRQYCCQAGNYDPATGKGDYGKPCSTDLDCSDGDACWHLPNTQAVCACRGFIVAASCPNTVCTNENAPGAEPPFGHCSRTAASNACIGDDTVHEVFPRAYTWPNDPQTYDCDARIFRVTFAPGGSPVPITASGDIELCSTLPPAYGYTKAMELCSGVTGKEFAGARISPANWDCAVTGATLGVLCRW